jgi:hypothetical protein
MRQRGYDEAFARRIYRQILGFGEYGFPESHAASFALLVYVSAWLKCHEPAAFLAALLNSQPMGFYAPAQLVREARRQGVEVRPVDVRCSGWDCTLEGAAAAAPEGGRRSQPPVRLGLPQKALSVNMGPETNVMDLSFQNNALAPTLVEGQVQDRTTNQQMPVQTFASTRVPLSSQPSVLVNQPNVRTRRFQGSGLNTLQAFSRAQGETDSSTDDVVTASGELDATRYGDLLQARGLVGLRGAGFTYDGFYYVKRVTHNIRPGEYRQSFTITREGVGTNTPVVRPQ